MVALAPHLVRPLPLVVPAFEGAQPGPARRRRAEPLRRDVGRARAPALRRATRRRKGARDAAERPTAGEAPSASRGRRVLEPRAPPRDLGRGSARAAAGAGRARADERLPVLRLPDRRRAARADGARRGRALRRGVRQSRRRDGAARARRDAPAACARATARAARSSRCAPPTSINATGVWADELRPQELHDEAELPTHPPEPRHAHHAALTRTCRSSAARSCRPARGARSSRCPGSGTRWSARPTTTTRARSSTSSPPTDDVAYLLDAINAFFGTELGARRADAAPSPGVRPLISTGRPEEVGRHLAQGRAVRDLLGDDHDHRRQADDLAADGEDDRRPARRCAKPATRPAARTKSRSGRRSRRRGAAARGGRARASPTQALAARYGHAAHEVLALAAERGELAQPIVAGLPGPARRGGARGAPASRRAASADVLLRRTRLGLLAARELCRRSGRRRGGAWPTCSRGELGWDRERTRAEIERFAEEARAEGAARAREPDAPRACPRRRRLRSARGRRTSSSSAQRPLLMGDRQRLARLLQRRRPPPDARRPAALGRAAARRTGADDPRRRRRVGDDGPAARGGRARRSSSSCR